MTNFDPDTFRMPEEIDLDAVRNRPPKKPPRHRMGEEFLKGPIPWVWLRRAMALPGKAMSIAMLLWKEAGIRNRRTVKINLSALAGLGLTRASARRGLQSLASAKLVTVTHRPGQALEVTLLDTLAENADG
jgi:hypothetical protein